MRKYGSERTEKTHGIQSASMLKSNRLPPIPCTLPNFGGRNDLPHGNIVPPKASLGRASVPNEAIRSWPSGSPAAGQWAQGADNKRASSLKMCSSHSNTCPTTSWLCSFRNTRPTRSVLVPKTRDASTAANPATMPRIAKRHRNVSAAEELAT